MNVTFLCDGKYGQFKLSHFEEVLKMRKYLIKIKCCNDVSPVSCRTSYKRKKGKFGVGMSETGYGRNATLENGRNLLISGT